jgi:hypothetical protein
MVDICSIAASSQPFRRERKAEVRLALALGCGDPVVRVATPLWLRRLPSSNAQPPRW